MNQGDEININTAANVTGLLLGFFQLLSLLAVFFIVSRYSYPLAHNMIELSTVFVSVTIFAIAWSSRKFIDNNYLLIISIAVLFSAMFDVFHLFALYENITPLGEKEGILFWMMARIICSFSFLLAIIFLRKKVYFWVLFSVYSGVSLGILYFIFNLPPRFSDPVFFSKIWNIADSLSAASFIAGFYLLYKERKGFEPRFVTLLGISLILMALSSLTYTFPFQALANKDITSHLFKAVSYFFLYLGMVETGLMRPYRVLFKNLKDREVSVAESEERYRSVVENVPNAILLLDGSEIIYINSAGVELMEASSVAELKGKKLISFIPKEYRKAINDRNKSMKKGLKSNKIEFKIKTLNNKILDVSSTATITTLRRKNVFQLTLSDITKRKQYEHQIDAYTKKIEHYAKDLNKFKLAVDNASDAIYITDKDFEVMYANHATEKVTGYDLAELMGKPIIFWRDVSNDRNILKQIGLPGKEQITESITEEVVNRKKNGQTYTASLVISPIAGSKGEVAYYVIIERDITRQKEIDQAKTEFVSLASHQLRTPLAAIALSSELFLRGVYGELSDKQKESLREIFLSSCKMKELISDLLNISRIELGTFAVKFEALNFHEQVEDMLKEHELLMKKKSIILVKEINSKLGVMQLDKNILQIVFDNLLSNAIRYTPEKGTIAVGYKKKGNDVIFWVRDTGFGIPTEQQGKIFDKLFRADNAQLISSEGSGLGLYMAKSVLKKIGGGIWVESVQGQGSAFFVRIPIKKKWAVYCDENMD